MTEIPPAARAAITELLVRELRTLFERDLAAGVPRDELVEELHRRRRLIEQH